MKQKLLSLLVLLTICAGSSWAQSIGPIGTVTVGEPIKTIDDIVEGQVYTITSGGNRGAFVYTDNGLSSTVQQSTQADPNNTNQQFAFIKYKDVYQLYAVGADKFIYVTGKNENNNRAVPVDIPVNTTFEILASTYSGNATNPAVLCIDGHHLGISPSYTPSVITHYNDVTDEGNALCILPVDDVTVDVDAINQKLAAMIQVTYQITNPFGEVVSFEGPSVAANSTVPTPAINYLTDATITNENKTVTADNKTFTVTGTWNFPMEENKNYMIKTANSGYFVCNGTNAAHTGFSVEGTNDLWQFEHVANTLDQYKLKNVKYGYANYANSNNQTLMTFSEGSEGSIFRITPNATGGFNLQHPKNAQANAGNHVSNNLGFWTNSASANNNGSSWIVNEVTDLKHYHPTTHATTLNGTYMIYNAYNGNDNRSSLMYSNNGNITHSGGAHALPLTFQSRNEYLWEIRPVADVENGYTIKSVSAQKYVAANGSASEEAVTIYIQPWETSTHPKPDGVVKVNSLYGQKSDDLSECFTIGGSASGQSGNNCWNGNPTAFTLWSNSHPWVFYNIADVEESIGDATLKVAQDYAEYMVEQNVPITNYGKYNQWTDEYVKAITAGTSFAEYVTAINNTTQQITITVTPQEGDFLRIRSVKNGNGYVVAKASSAHSGCLAIEQQEQPDVNTIYLFTDNKLVAYNEGKYLIKNSDGGGFCALGAVGAEGCSISFPIATKSDNAFSVVYSGSRYLYAADNATNTDAGSSEGNNAYNFTLEKVTTLPVTLGSVDGKRYATFYAPAGITDLDGVKAYTVTKEDGKAKMTAVDQIPAETAVVLYSNDSNKETANLTIGEVNSINSANLLAGNTATKVKEDGCLTLQNNTNTGIGFYLYNGANLKGFHAYIPADNASSVKGMALDFDMETIIRGIEEAEQQTTEMYDLSGRRIQKAQKGIYIVNGKKVIK